MLRGGGQRRTLLLAGAEDVGALSAFVTYVGVPGSAGSALGGPTYLSVSGFSGSVEDQRDVLPAPIVNRTRDGV
jgi:hypothetical protein